MKKLPYIWLILWFGSAVASKTVFHQTFEHSLSHALQEGSATHWLGFDAFGRDLLATTLEASKLSSFIAVMTTLVCCILAFALGGFMAMASPGSRALFQRILEALLAFPSLLLALSWSAIRGPGWDTLVVSLALGILPSFSRLIFVRAREILSEDYIQAARALGAGPFRIFFIHLTPALSSLCAIKIPGLFAYALLAEATLSYLGVGAPIGHDTWGSLLAQGKDYLIEAPHLALGTGIPLVLTILSLQLITEAKLTETQLGL